jgi:hypothetical protein
MSNNYPRNDGVGFDYNRIREMTGKLKENLKDKYNNLQQITQDIGGSLTNASDTNQTFTQASVLDSYIGDIESLFNDGTYNGNMLITGKLNVDRVEANELFVKNLNNSNIIQLIQNTIQNNVINQSSSLIDILRTQDLRLNNQTLISATLNGVTINGGILNDIVVNGGTLNNVLITNSEWKKDGTNIYNTNVGNVGIGTNIPTYKLDVLGETRIQTDNVRIGKGAGDGNIGNNFISIGNFAGSQFQEGNTIAIGTEAGFAYQSPHSIAIGTRAGFGIQLPYSISIGYFSGETAQGYGSIALGYFSGRNSQGGGAIAIGPFAGFVTQGDNSIAFGNGAGATNQGSYSISMGIFAGSSNQQGNGVAIGSYSGRYFQGNYSIAMGSNAGENYQHDNSIILNATGVTLDSDGTDRFFVAPIRNAATVNTLYYNTTTSEITYDSSTYKTKKNIEDITVDTSILYKLQPKKYHYIDDEQSGHHIGYMAEDVASLNYNFAVYETPYPSDVPCNVNWKTITVYMMEEIKNLNKRIADLEARI